MFVRVKTVRSEGRTYRYLHIVENRWEDGRTRQRIVGSLGRLEDLLAQGDLERVVTQLVEHCPSVKLLRAQAQAEVPDPFLSTRLRNLMAFKELRRAMPCRFRCNVVTNMS